MTKKKPQRQTKTKSFTTRLTEHQYDMLYRRADEFSRKVGTKMERTDAIVSALRLDADK